MYITTYCNVLRNDLRTASSNSENSMQNFEEIITQKLVNFEEKSFTFN